MKEYAIITVLIGLCIIGVCDACSRSQCEKRDCILGCWSEWNPCYDGKSNRTRAEIVNAKCGGQKCTQDRVQGRKCCTATQDCNMTSWSPWGDCNEEIQIRTHKLKEACTCSEERIMTLQSRSCYSKDSVCSMGPWSTWSSCTDQSQTRTRQSDPACFRGKYMTEKQQRWCSK